MESLQIAQEKGIAESDQSLDVKGFYSACKISLLANSAYIEGSGANMIC